MTLPPNQAIRPRFRAIDGVSIRYAESEDRDDHALLLGPWPESLYCYAPTWSRLADRAHLVAIDLPGFGHSERRDALMAPCTSPLAHSSVTFLPCLLPIRAAGRPRIMLNSTPQMAAIIPQARYLGGGGPGGNMPYPG